MIDQAEPIPVHITNVDTGEVTVKKMLISKFVERYNAIAEQYMKMGKYAVIGEFYDDLIWTFRVDTAATDGIRIYFNPIFVYELVETCGPLADAKQTELKRKGVNVKDPRSGFDMTFEVAKGFIFVIIHECYHQLYRHIEQSKRKKETRNPTPSIHRLANISMDDEINRDIEEQFPEFEGITKLIEGCIEKEEYPHEIWMDIFDDKMQKGQKVPAGPTIPPPQRPTPPGGGGQQPDQPEQEIEAPQDYVDGWKQAIDDFKAGKLDPKKFKPLPVDQSKFGHPQMNGGLMFARIDEAAGAATFNQDEYNQGYNDCVQKILNNMMNQGGGGQQPKGGLKVKNLPEPPSFGGGGQGQGDSQKQQQQQNQQQQQGGGGGQSGQQQQNQQAGKGSGGGSGSDRQNQKSNNHQGGGGGGTANSSQEIDKMSGQQAANSAQQSANNAQQSADAAQQAAN